MKLKLKGQTVKSTLPVQVTIHSFVILKKKRHNNLLLRNLIGSKINWTFWLTVQEDSSDSEPIPFSHFVFYDKKIDNPLTH